MQTSIRDSSRNFVKGVGRGANTTIDELSLGREVDYNNIKCFVQDSRDIIVFIK